jgi:hypothetical protein
VGWEDNLKKILQDCVVLAEARITLMNNWEEAVKAINERGDKKM